MKHTSHSSLRAEGNEPNASLKCLATHTT